MNPAPPLPFPGSRTVAAWWRELAPHRPLRLWLSHLLIHRVEAQVEVRHAYRLGRLRLEVLRVLARGRRPEGLDPVLLARLTRELTAAGFFSRTDSQLQLTESGRRALASGSASVGSLERRTFCFLDNRTVQRPPHFLCVRRGGAPVAPPEPWDFDPGLLGTAAHKEALWKERFGFPEDVSAVRLPEPTDPDWKSIVVDRAEHLFVAFVQVEANEGGHRFSGFAAQTKGWTLEAHEPIIDAGADCGEVLPDLAVEPSEAEWRAAWQAWGQQRGLPAVEMADCRLERSGNTLRVNVPRKLMVRLRETRSDALHGETWLLAGTGRTRSTARVAVVEREH
jgi:hypothetical protein